MIASRAFFVSWSGLALLACGGSNANTKPDDTTTVTHEALDAGPVEATQVQVPTPTPTSAPVASDAPAPSSTAATPVDDEAAKETADTKVASAVRDKGGHKKCLMGVLDAHPGWKPKRYEIVVHLLADGHVKKVVVDKKKSDTSVPEFLTCLAKQLESETFPAPGREVSARLSYPTH